MKSIKISIIKNTKTLLAAVKKYRLRRLDFGHWTRVLYKSLLKKFFIVFYWNHRTIIKLHINYIIFYSIIYLI